MLPPPTAKVKPTSRIKPLQTMRGHTMGVSGVVHLRDRGRIITSSYDGSLRLWNLESGVQIGNDWRDDEGGDRGDGKEGVWIIALSPNGKTVASGSDRKVRLWDVETEKVVARWAGHTGDTRSLCWSVDGERVVSGSFDGTIRVWDVGSGDTVLGPINTGHQDVQAVIYSPDTTMIATGGFIEAGLKIWDAKTGNLLSTIKHDHSPVWHLAWTSDQKKIIAGSDQWSIEIFDTATWQRIAILEGHTSSVYFLSLFQNDRLLASGSADDTARLWNLDTNLPVGPPIQHQQMVYSVAISPDGNQLVTGCSSLTGTDNNVYVWDIHTTLKNAGLEHLLSTHDVPQDVLKQKSLMDTDAPRRRTKHEYAYRLPPRFFDDERDGVQSSAAPVTNPEPRLRGFAPFSAFRGHALPSLFRSSQPNTHEATALQSPPRRSGFSRHRTRVVEVATAQDRQPVYVAPRQQPPGDKGKDMQQQQGQLESQAQLSKSQSPSAVASMSTRPPPNDSIPTAGVAGTQPHPAATGKNTPWWARLVLFVCCAPTIEGR